MYLASKRLAQNETDQNAIEEYEEAVEQLASFFNAVGQDDFKECDRIESAHYKRVHRLKKRISLILSQSGKNPFDDTEQFVMFLTFTFTDEALQRTSPETRRTMVARWLKENSIDYVANIDFGKTNGREHYHGVAIFNHRVDFSSWTYGNLDHEIVRVYDETSIPKLAHYTAKLSNHAVKETTKRNCVIYCRHKGYTTFYNPETHSYTSTDWYNPYENNT